MSHEEYEQAKSYYEQHKRRSAAPFHHLTEFARVTWLLAATNRKPEIREVKR